MPDVTLEVTAKLDKIVTEMAKISNLGKDTKRMFEEMSKAMSKTTIDQTQKVQQQAQKTSSLFKRVLESMRSDIKALASVEALQAGLKLTNQFKGSIEQSVKLGDTIRRLGPTLGIAAKNFAQFQATFMKGLGDIGMSSESATKALEGLSETPVKGTENLLEYAKAAGMLTQIGGQKGQEGQVAKGMSGLIQARGGNVNDLKEMKKIAEDLRRVQVATGKGPTETIAAMTEMFQSMSSDFRKTVTTRGLSQMAAAAHAAGPQSTKFLESFLQLSKTQRAGLTARGVGGLVNPEGALNTENIKKFYYEAKKLGQGDIRLGLKAMGIESDEAAEGFVRLADHLDEVKKAQEGVANASGNLADQFEDSKGLIDQFQSSINKMKGAMGGVIGKAAQMGTDVLKSANKSTLGSGAVVAGAGIAAALLGGGGIKGIMGLAGGFAKDEARKKSIEAITGEKVQDVNVVNADEIGEGHEGGGMMGGALGTAAKWAGGVGLAATAGVAVGTGIEYAIDNSSIGKLRDAMFDAIIEGRKHTDSMGRNIPEQKVKVNLTTNTREIKATTQPTRGATQ